MPKVRPLDERAVLAARRLLEEAGVWHAHQIDVERLAAMRGAMVLYGRMATARGVLVRAGRHAIIQIDERARDTAAARFTTAHEMGHHDLHALVDHFAQCTIEDAPRSDAAWVIEREANAFATELLIPEVLGAPMCAVERAQVGHVGALARAFRTSFEMTAIRFVELTMAPCAVVVSEAGNVKWALESLTFPGAIPNWRRLHVQSVAARLPRRRGAEREREVPGAAWKGDAPFVERAWRVGAERVVSWIVPA